MTSDEFGGTRTYIENCLDNMYETETQKLLTYQKRTFGNEEHLFFVMMLKAQSDFTETTSYKYTICGTDLPQTNPCMELNSLSNKYIRQVIEKARISVTCLRK